MQGTRLSGLFWSGALLAVAQESISRSCSKWRDYSFTRIRPSRKQATQGLFSEEDNRNEPLPFAECEEIQTPAAVIASSGGWGDATGKLALPLCIIFAVFEVEKEIPNIEVCCPQSAQR
jgi:hypothetical protein